jgi:UDP-N-acetylmuramoyl-tripeptide--D-alanyl-D-alanine ligase
MADLSLKLVLTATGGRLVGEGAPAVFRGVCTDTRARVRGSLFVALKGERFDGHDFVAEALRLGAGAALVSRDVPGAQPLIAVGDTLQALGAMAAAHRASVSPRVIAITGSTGKTTTKEMAAGILSQGWRTARTPGNFNNEIGVPLALLDLEPSHEAAVVELAMRGRGQIDALARMVQPQVGAITNIGVSHLELLGSREAIAGAKAELLDNLPGDGAAILNADDEFLTFLSERSPCRVVTFGRGEAADVQVREIVASEDGSTAFTLRGWWGEERIRVPAAGRHQAMNAAAAAAAAMTAGAKAEWLAPGLEAFEGAEMRTRIVRAPGGFTVIDDCYNAAPDSMRVALELLADLPGARKWAALGDMKELGPLAADWHREVGELAAEMRLAGLITRGELGKDIAEGARGGLPGGAVAAAESNEEAAALLADRLSPGDVVLVKGSRAMKMEEIVKGLLAVGAKSEGGGA